MLCTAFSTCNSLIQTPPPKPRRRQRKVCKPCSTKNRKYLDACLQQHCHFPPSSPQWIALWALRQIPLWIICSSTLFPGCGNHNPGRAAMYIAGFQSKLCAPPICASGDIDLKQAVSDSRGHSESMSPGRIFPGRHNRGYTNNKIHYYLKFPKTNKVKKCPPSNTTHQQINSSHNNSQTATSGAWRVNYMSLTPIKSYILHFRYHDVISDTILQIPTKSHPYL